MLLWAIHVHVFTDMNSRFAYFSLVFESDDPVWNGLRLRSLLRRGAGGDEDIKGADGVGGLSPYRLCQHGL